MQKEAEQVGFSVKELFVEIRADIRNVQSSINQKANNSEMETLRGRLESIERTGSHNAQEAMKKVDSLDDRFNAMGWKIAGALVLAAGSTAFTVVWSLVKR